jgi:hypothetical protein
MTTILFLDSFASEKFWIRFFFAPVLAVSGFPKTPRAVIRFQPLGH